MFGDEAPPAGYDTKIKQEHPPPPTPKKNMVDMTWSSKYKCVYVCLFDVTYIVYIGHNLSAVT